MALTDNEWNQTLRYIDRVIKRPDWTIDPVKLGNGEFLAWMGDGTQGIYITVTDLDRWPDQRKQYEPLPNAQVGDRHRWGVELGRYSDAMPHITDGEFMPYLRTLCVSTHIGLFWVCKRGNVSYRPPRHFEPPNLKET